jgi:lysophospholipase L1-like esterase
MTGPSVRVLRSAFALMCALAGCGSGCDGEHRRPPEQPRPVRAPDVAPAITSAPAAAPAERPNAGAALPPVFLDAPAGSLDAVFTGLAAAERSDPGARVLWLFFGDSHTAGDSMTSRLRVTLQGRFGDAGRGLVAAGKPPSKYYYQRDVRYGASGRWKVAIGGHKSDSEPYGVAGLRVYGERKGAQLWVETCADCAAGTSVAQFEILYYAAPDHGVLRYRVDDRPWQKLATRIGAAEPPHPARQVIPVVDGPHRLTLEHGGGGALGLFGVVMERVQPGVIVDSLGVVGRRLGSLRSWDWSVIGEQLASRDPRLVALQYGTNEADDRDLDLEAMARYFDDTITRIRAAAPTASILIIGPPDMAVREAGKQCDRMKRGRRSKLAGGDPDDAPLIPECEWRTPHVLSEIIAVQHAAAARNRVAFFDTFAAMGGADRINEWYQAEPRMAYKDRVHLTDIGYQWWADALSSAVLAEYAKWRLAHSLPPTGALELPPPLDKPTDAALPGNGER